MLSINRCQHKKSRNSLLYEIFLLHNPFFAPSMLRLTILEIYFRHNSLTRHILLNAFRQIVKYFLTCFSEYIAMPQGKELTPSMCGVGDALTGSNQAGHTTKTLIAGNYAQMTTRPQRPYQPFVSQTPYF